MPDTRSDPYQAETALVFKRELPTWSQFVRPSRQHRRCRLCLCDEVPGRFSDFLERAHLDLPDAFTRHVKLQREIAQRQWLVDQMPRPAYRRLRMVVVL